MNKCPNCDRLQHWLDMYNKVQCALVELGLWEKVYEHIKEQSND